MGDKSEGKHTELLNNNSKTQRGRIPDTVKHLVTVYPISALGS